MRFGLFFQAPESAGRSHVERFAEMFDLIALAESLGFDVAWLAQMPVHVGATAVAARDAMRPGVHQYYRNLQTIFSALPESYGDHLPRLRMIEDTVANLPYERFCRDQAVFGDAAEVLDRLEAAREEFELSEIICWFDQGSMPPREEVERAMRRFAEQVMPKLA